jgi:hypothetical protein
MIEFDAIIGTEFIKQHVVMRGEQRPASYTIHEILEDGMGYGISIEGAGASTEFIHDS